MRLQVLDLSKAYAAPVLRAIDLTVEAGEIRGVVGENGAGKSTFFNILSGLAKRDAGAILLDGEPFAPANAREAFREGVSIATQEMSLIGPLTIAENLRLRVLPTRFGWIRRSALDEAAAALIEALGLRGATPATPLSALSLADRQMLEFGKAIATPSRLLILDEPTAALSSEQADRLHRLMRERAEAGTAILYASHRLEDVRTVCDRVSVMRDGRMVRTDAATAMTAGSMIEAMSGRRLEASAPRPARAGSSRVLLSARGIRTDALPEPIDIDLHAGEIVGLAGLAGAGRTELIEALFGLARLRGGSVERIDGNRLPITSPRQAAAAGMGLVTEDRKASGIFAGHGIGFNAALPSLPGRLLVDRPGLDRKTQAMIETLGVRCAGPQQDIAALSGGNQQKILFGRWLMTGAKVLLLDEPGRGVDVAAKHDIYAQLRRLADEGAAILIASSELEELTQLCDRVLVLSARRLVASFTGPDWDESAILAAAFREHLADKRSLSPGIMEQSR